MLEITVLGYRALAGPVTVIPGFNFERSPGSVRLFAPAATGGER